MEKLRRRMGGGKERCGGLGGGRAGQRDFQSATLSFSSLLLIDINCFPHSANLISECIVMNVTNISV